MEPLPRAWGLSLDVGKIYTIKPKRTINITNAALGVVLEGGYNSDRNIIYLRDEGTHIQTVIAILRFEKHEQQKVKVIIEAGESFSFYTRANYKIHLTGFYYFTFIEDYGDDEVEIKEDSSIPKNFELKVESSTNNKRKLVDSASTADNLRQNIEENVAPISEKEKKPIISHEVKTEEDTIEIKRKKKKKKKKKLEEITNGRIIKKIEKKKTEEITSGPIQLKYVSTEIFKMTSGLEYQELILGAGSPIKLGHIVTVNLEVFDQQNNLLFTLENFAFRVGLEQVIKGLDQGIQSMRVGGSRRLLIPKNLSYNQHIKEPSPDNKIKLSGQPVNIVVNLLAAH